jgi:hypothetical protein
MVENNQEEENLSREVDELLEEGLGQKEGTRKLVIVSMFLGLRILDRYQLRSLSVLRKICTLLSRLL